ncbi:MAG: GNAT family N-acetyltransferase [Anaerolineae bacterium]
MTLPEPNIPFDIHTDRLHLRAPEPDYAQEIYDAVRDSLPELTPWIDWAPTWDSPQKVEEIIYRSRVWFYNREAFIWYIYEQATARFVGVMELHSVDWEVPRAEVGYWLRTSGAGHGYMTEAVAHITTLALKDWGFTRLQALCDARNTRAIQVAERTGFVREGLLKQYERDAAGELCDILLLARCTP